MTKDTEHVQLITEEEKLQGCENCNSNNKNLQIRTTTVHITDRGDSSDVEPNSQDTEQGLYQDLPPLHTVRYWISMLATLLCLQSFIFCVVCLSPENVSKLAPDSDERVALEVTARKTLLDLGIITIAVTIGFLLFLRESMCSSDPIGAMSPLLVAYKLFQMIVLVDVAVRLLQGLHLTLAITEVNIIHLITIFIFPIMAATLEITMTVASFIHLQNYYKENQQQKILAIP